MNCTPQRCNQDTLWLPLATVMGPGALWPVETSGPSLRGEVMLGRVLEHRMTLNIFLCLCSWNSLFLEAASGAQEPSQGRRAAGD